MFPYSGYLYCWINVFLLAEMEVCMSNWGFHNEFRWIRELLRSIWMIVVVVKSSPTYYKIRATGSGPGTRKFITQSWSPSFGIKFYVNSCIVATETERQPRKHDVTWDANFRIGDVRKWVEMEMNNFLAWDGELTQDEIWRLYMQAGQVWESSFLQYGSRHICKGY